MAHSACTQPKGAKTVADQPEVIEGALVPQDTPSTAIQPAWSREQINLIRDTVARDTTDTEFELFLYTAHRMGLDPLLRQIHAVKRWDSNLGRMAMAVQTGIDGYRLIADRTGKYAPGREPSFVYDEHGHVVAATAYVMKLVSGTWHEVGATAHYSEYVGLKKDGKPNSMWAGKPHIMLAKCAEAIALRRAFPAEMAGVYTKEEMPEAEEVRRGEQAGSSGSNVTAPAPASTSGRGKVGAQSRGPTTDPAPAPPTTGPSQSAYASEPDINAPLKNYLDKQEAKKQKDGMQVAEQILKVQPSLEVFDQWLAQNAAMGMIEPLTATHLRIALTNKLVHESETTLAKDFILKAKNPQEAAAKMVERLQQVAQEREHVESGADLDHIVTKPRAVPVRRWPKMSQGGVYRGKFTKDKP